MAFKVEDAVKLQSRLRLVMSGPSGSGKTHSALLVMSGIVGPKGRIILIDTENGRASLKAGEPGIPAFKRIGFDAPYTVDRYIEAIQAALAFGCDGLIVDSATHEWAGEGGILSRKEQVDARGGNSYTNWAPFTKEHERFMAALLGLDAHLIAAVRSKQDYIVEQNEKGKSAPRKIGMAPQQREGLEYNFSFHFDLAMNHEAKVLKTDFSAIDGQIFVPTVATGEQLRAWLEHGAPRPVTITKADADVLRDLGTKKGITGQAFLEFLGVSRLGELTVNQYAEAKKRLEAYQPPVEQKDVDAEIEQLVRLNIGIGFNQVVDYIEGLPFPKNLKSVAGHLAALRAERTTDELRAIFKVEAAA